MAFVLDKGQKSSRKENVIGVFSLQDIQKGILACENFTKSNLNLIVVLSNAVNPSTEEVPQQQEQQLPQFEEQQVRRRKRTKAKGIKSLPKSLRDEKPESEDKWMTRSH